MRRVNICVKTNLYGLEGLIKYDRRKKSEVFPVERNMRRQKDGKNNRG